MQWCRLFFLSCEVAKGNAKRRKYEIRLPFLSCEAAKGNAKRRKCEIRLPFLACEAAKGNAKRGKCEIRLPFLACEAAKGNVKRKERRRRCVEDVFCPHAPLRAPFKCERSRMGKSQPQLSFKT